MLGYNNYEKSLNGIKVLSDGIANNSDGNATFNTTTSTNLITTNLTATNTTTTNLTVSNVNSNITQGTTHIISQSGTGTNALKGSAFSGNITQASSNMISQTGSGTNTLKNTQVNNLTQSSGSASLQDITVNGDLTTGNIIQTSGASTMRAITQAGGFSITQSGTSTNSNNTNTLRNINMANAHVISQTGTGTNVFKDSQISTITSVGGITQSSGSSSLRDVTCNDITMRSGKSITQSGTTNNNLGTTTVSNLVVLTSMEFPAEVTVPEATQTGDLTFTGDAKIVQDITSSTTNVFKDSSFKSMTVNGDITQTSGTATFKTLTCENPSYSGDLLTLTDDSSATFENVTINKELSVLGNTTLTNLSLLDASGNIVVSDTEFRRIAGLSSNVQTQLDDLSANAQTQIDNVSANIQTQIDDIIAVNDQQTTDIDDLRNDHDTHVSNAVLLTGDQTVGGVKTFTSHVLTNGITNTGSITSSTITVNDKFSVGNAIKAYENAIESFSSPISVGLSDVLIC
ncbi:MAG: hypothetical protein EOP47_21705, partial [Sphingobacteriaceae bacterium]